MRIVQGRVQEFVDAHVGRLPQGAEWGQLIEINDFMDAKKGPLKKVNDLVRARLFQQMQAEAQGRAITAEMNALAKVRHLELMKYESQLATFLIAHAENQAGMVDDDLAKLFVVVEAAPAERHPAPQPTRSRTLDPNDKSGALSPLGFVHLFRQYFFELDTFLGPPVEPRLAHARARPSS